MQKESEAMKVYLYHSRDRYNLWFKSVEGTKSRIVEGT
jgi:hypothetical protein